MNSRNTKDQNMMHCATEKALRDKITADQKWPLNGRGH